ncbi:putative calpain-like cysteine peptidase [Trypanosoma vivax]|nr:putative calpain-like cysteine peptidase [Trypanosoma vivax]
MALCFAGLSPREVYEMKCVEMHCRKNSALCRFLSDTPDDFNSLTLIDLSKNFVGPRGILPLLEMVRFCKNLKELDLREQQLDQNAIDVICLVLRNHPAVVLLNLSDNPLTMSAGLSLLQLAKANPNIGYIILERTHIKPSLLRAIEAQLKTNLSLKDGIDGHDSSSVGSPRNARLTVKNVFSADTTRSTKSLDLGRASLSRLSSTVTKNSTTIQSEGSPNALGFFRMHDLEELLLTFSRSVHEVLFDENPIPAIAELCKSHQARFYDSEIAINEVAPKRHGRVTHNVQAWRRIAELYPSATLFPNCNDDTSLALPRECFPTFSWIFTCVGALFSDFKSLKQTLLCSPHEDHGLYALRVFIDGQWRYVIVDDFLPVDKKDELVFTKPVDGKYFWPCILEKAMAKLNGSYTALDISVVSKIVSHASLGRHQGFTGSSSISQQIMKSTTCTEVEVNNIRQTNFSKTLQDLSGGVGILRILHSEEFHPDEWWATMLDVFRSGAMMVALSSEKPLTGITPYHAYSIVNVQHVNGMKLLRLSSPWSLERWKGDWSDESPLWQTHRDVNDALRMKLQRSDPFTFWLQYSDFLASFCQVHLCLVLEGFHHRSVEGKWDLESAGGPCFSHQWHRNPHFHLNIPSSTNFFMNLALPDTRFTPTDIQALAIHILRSPFYPVRYRNNSEDIVTATSYVLTDSISVEGLLEAGDDYWIVPSTDMKGAMGRFILRTFTRSPFVMSSEALGSHWNTVNFTDKVECSGEYHRGDDNAQVLLCFDSCENALNHGASSGTVLIRVRTLEMSEFGIGLFLVRSNIIEGKPSRTLGMLSKESIVTSSSFTVSDRAYLEATVKPGETYTLITCVDPAGSSVNLKYMIWSSLPLPRRTIMPVWEKKVVPVCWSEGSGSFYEVRNNPQVEIFPARLHDTFVIRMQVTECSCTDPAILFFVLKNDGRLGEGIKGVIPVDRVLLRSQYVRSSEVQCELFLEEPMDSLLIIPCLQPIGSKGQCTITISTESGMFSARTLSASGVATGDTNRRQASIYFPSGSSTM